MLQAMTAPDECAKLERSCENNENYPNDSAMSPQWGPHPNYLIPPSPLPYFYNPYWNYYNTYGHMIPKSDEINKNYYQNAESDCDSNMNQKQNPRATPVIPLFCWPYNENDTVPKNCRNTPTSVPFWPYYPPNFYGNTQAGVQEGSIPDRSSTPYPPWNPYCYYYGAPPPLPHMYNLPYSPHPFNQPPPSDNDENSGYSSTDEMAYYGARFNTMPPFANSSVQPKIKTVTNLQQQVLEEIKEKAKKLEDSRRKRQELDKENDVLPKPAEINSTHDELDSDSELEGYEICIGPNNLQTIPSVTNINVYDEDEASDEIEDSESTTDDIDDSLGTVDEAIPHQLSVIFEESERTESIARYARENSVESATTDGTNTLENTDNEEGIEEETTVFIKLPLRINYTLTNNQKPTIATVQNTEVAPQVATQHEIVPYEENKAFTDSEEMCTNNTECETEDVDWWAQLCRSQTDKMINKSLSRKNITNQSESNDTDVAHVDIHSSSNNESDEEIDFWATIRKDESYVNIRQKINERQYNLSDHDTIEAECEDESNSLDETERPQDHVPEELPANLDEDLDSIKCQGSSDFCDNVINNKDILDDVFVEETKTNNEDSSSTCYLNGNLSGSSELNTNINSSAITENINWEHCNLKIIDYQQVKPLSIQERINALYKSSLDKQSQCEEEVLELVKEQTSSNHLLSIDDSTLSSRKNSLKLGDCGSEDDEEVDSGVTSDISRHISEADIDLDITEYKRISKYQRASTHSRLFRLLQDETDNEDETNKNIQNCRDHLTLPLQTNLSNPESYSSSGFTSPGSPNINEKFVNELIEMLLVRKQGKVFKNINMEKLHSAALRILQDDMDGLETLSSSEDGGSFLSPKKPGTGRSTPAHTPQEFSSNINLNEYNQYYETWGGTENFEEVEIIPSKAFRLIQEHVAKNKTGAISGLIARCPRVLSNKNIQKELMRLIELQENSSLPDPSKQTPNINEATSAS